MADKSVFLDFGADWYLSGSTSQAIFTASAAGERTGTYAFSGGTTGVTATLVSTQTGSLFVREMRTLTVTGAASGNGNITITLNGTAHTVAVLSGDTVNAVATKVRAAYFSVGWRDITSEVLYNDLTIEYNACSDNFHYSQNTASISIRHESTLFPLIRDVQGDIRIKIMEGASFLFTGRIPPSKSYTYDGILEVVIITLEAEDDIMLLEKAVGDVAYQNFKIMDGADKPHSIMHQLAYLAGWTDTQIDQTILIDTTLAAFVPPSPEDTILDMMDTLLFEYGWVLNINNAGQIAPIQWMLASNTYVYTFDETNIVRELSREETVRKYEGAEVTYYELGNVSSTLADGSILIYRDDKLPMNDIGEFTGYVIPAGYTYPVETNTIDETTGVAQIVYQDYDDTGIKYWTNRAITQSLDYNYKAFESDYSDMVLTTAHRIDWRGEAGITITTQEFGNRKARIVFTNGSASPADIDYFLIYADVIYKTAERKAIVENVAGSIKLDKYVSTFLFTKVHADLLCQYLAEQHIENDYQYKFMSEHFVAPGNLVRLTTNEGTDKICFVTTVAWDEAEQLWRYE